MIQTVSCSHLFPLFKAVLSGYFIYPLYIFFSFAYIFPCYCKSFVYFSLLLFSDFYSSTFPGNLFWEKWWLKCRWALTGLLSLVHFQTLSIVRGYVCAVPLSACVFEEWQQMHFLFFFIFHVWRLLNSWYLRTKLVLQPVELSPGPMKESG